MERVASRASEWEDDVLKHHNLLRKARCADGHEDTCSKKISESFYGMKPCALGWWILFKFGPGCAGLAFQYSNFSVVELFSLFFIFMHPATLWSTCCCVLLASETSSCLLCIQLQWLKAFKVRARSVSSQYSYTE